MTPAELRTFLLYALALCVVMAIYNLTRSGRHPSARGLVAGFVGIAIGIAAYLAELPMPAYSIPPVAGLLAMPILAGQGAKKNP
ncbi:MAG: hypothetical protein SFX74_04750 [Fimbriimonadaceae bacterium]|nr:hypothetical protein [Fimbriimonadaceae bacterium]